jgi:hypothetical protein
MNRSIRQPLEPLTAPFWLLMVLGALFLILPACVWYYQLSSPSDGARMSKQPETANPEGIYIEVLSADSPLQDGDLVTAVQGVSMPTWVEGLSHPGSWQLRWEAGEVIPYQVVREGHKIEAPVPLGKQPVQAILSENWSVLLFTVVFQLIAIFVLFQKPREPAAQALFIWGMATSHFYVWSSYLQIYDFVNGYGFWLFMIAGAILWLSAWPAGLHLTLTFPTPLPLVQRRPWLVWMLYPVSFTIYLLYQAISRIMIPSRLEWISRWNRGDILVALVMFIPAVITLVRQYLRHRSGPEKSKIQWVIFSALFSSSMVMILYLVPEFLGLPTLGVNAVGILLLPFPIAIALAIWRHQLFDINLIINRTLVYGALTLTLALVYFTSVVLLQSLLTAVGGPQTAVVTVLSTLLIAALFSPLRRRIQRDIDRRFYRKKYDAEKIVAEFGASLRNEVNLEDLQAQIVSVVEETMQPESASIWLRPVERPHRP